MISSPTWIDAATHTPVAQGGVIALGNFDGVHLGHWAVLQETVAQAHRHGVPARALTFEPHPYALFQKDGTPFLLTSPEAKVRALKAAGIENVVTLAFTPSFAAMPPEVFVRDVLIAGCGVQHVVVGFDFTFGAARGGDRAALRSWLEPLGVGVSEVPPLRDAEGEIISSTRIRAALRAGEPEKANSLLGHAFEVEGVVQAGDRRGRLLGYPTANIDLGNYVRPRFGVYMVTARSLADGTTLTGVANVGNRPTVDGAKELLEAHFFDFDGDLYGQEWAVALHAFLRPEKKFASLDALKAQMAQDVAEAGRLLASGVMA